MPSFPHKGKSNNLRNLNVFHLFISIPLKLIVSIFQIQSTGASYIKDIESILNSELVLVEFLSASVHICIIFLRNRNRSHIHTQQTMFFILLARLVCCGCS